MNRPMRTAAMGILAVTMIGTVGALTESATRPARAATTSTTVATLTVTGSADEQVNPDLAQVSTGVMTRASTAEKAQQLNNAAMTKVLKALQKLGIKQADVQTQWYNIQPNYGRPSPSGQQQVNGFSANDNINVTIHNLQQVGQVIDMLVQAGANQVNNVSYSVANPAQVQRSLYALAVDDARAQADIIAKKLGVTITGVQSVSTSMGGGIQPLYADKMPSASTATVLVPGTQDISTSLQVVYTIN